MGAAIWSAPAAEMLDFPAENFVAFFSNHRLLQYDRPVWRTVKGGSRRYVEKLTAAFRDRVRLGCAVTSIERTLAWRRRPRQPRPQRQLRSRRDRRAQRSGARACSPMPTQRERGILGAIGYAPNTVYLHRDERLMPKRRRAWASWNFLRWQREDTDGQRRRRDLLDEQSAGHRPRQAAVRQPQPAVRAGRRADLRQIHLRASAI